MESSNTQVIHSDEGTITIPLTEPYCNQNKRCSLGVLVVLHYIIDYDSINLHLIVHECGTFMDCLGTMFDVLKLDPVLQSATGLRTNPARDAMLSVFRVRCT